VLLCRITKLIEIYIFALTYRIYVLELFELDINASDWQIIKARCKSDSLTKARGVVDRALRPTRRTMFVVWQGFKSGSGQC